MLLTAPPVDRRGTATDPLAVLVVGAGFSGIGTVATLRARGVAEVVVLEKAHGVGGVWRDNTYPGAACDVKSHLYSFSFAPHHWSRTYAPQREILTYLRRVADEHGVVDHCRFGREVATADWDEDSGTWTVATTDGEVFVARVLVSGVGQLSRPAWPDLPGLQDFAGPVVHSARWDHDLDLTGRRVAVVGTGASAIQVVPGIVDAVGQMTVFQRSAPWVLPRGDRPYHDVEQALFEGVPGAQWLHRQWIFWTNELRVLAFNSQDSRLGWLVEQVAHRHRRRQVRDPVLQSVLEPDDPIGCKRVLVSDDWYPALDRDHVHVETAGIGRVVEDGIITPDGRLVEADVIVLGTGFRTTEFLVPMELTGRDGRRLHDAWADGARAHLGISVPGFPNLFLLYGPNTNLGHNSIIAMLEGQLQHVARAVDHLRARPGWSADVRPEVAEAFDEQVQEQLRRSVWVAGCHNWYRNEDGRVVNNWPGPAFRYRLATRRFVPGQYRWTEHVRARRPVPVTA